MRDRHAWYRIGFGAMLAAMASLAMLASGCGSSAMGDRAEEVERQRRRIRKRALVVRGPGTMTPAAGTALAIPIDLAIGAGFYVPSHSAGQRSLMPAWLELPDNRFAAVQGIDYPRGKLVRLPGYDDPVEVYDGDQRWLLKLKLHPSLQSGERAMSAKVHFQLCTVRGCEMPEVRVVRLVLDVRPVEATP